MARQVPLGTPKPARSPRYVFPGSNRRLLTLSLAVAGGLLLILVGGHFAGFRRVASPGGLATSHAPIDLRCVQCHDTRRRMVVDLRCERCHDPSGSARLTNAAHVLLGSADLDKAERAETVPCLQCHTDHRGRRFTLVQVDDRECARCHLFAALGRHPEFAVVKAQATTGLGITFDHDRHIVEAQKTTGKPCETCHQPTPDLRGFEPMAFDAACARCHVKDGFITGKSDPVAPDLLALPEQIGESWAASEVPRLLPAARGRVEVSDMRHRDRWVLYNALRLRRAIDPEGESAERAYLRGQIAWLEQQSRIEPLAAASPDVLSNWARALESEISAVDARLATSAEPASDALGGLAEAVQGIGAAIGEADPSLVPELSGLSMQVPADGPSPAEESAEQRAARFESQRRVLLRLLDAIAGRGDADLAARAASLRRRVERLTAGAGSPGPADAASFQRGLMALDEVFRAVRSLPDPGGAIEAAEIDELRRVAQQRVGGGLSAEDFDDRRRELLAALDAIERRGGDMLRPRVTELRQRVLALRPGSVGDQGLRRLRQQKQRLLDRVRLQWELAMEGETATVAIRAPLQDRRAIQATIDRLKARLTLIEGGPRVNAALSPEERETSGRALESLLGACLKCHELNGPRLAPVTAAEPVMPRSVFTHAPHVIQVDCRACHASAFASKRATDINVPGVATCQTCHKPRQTRADCATCHVYHPRSVADLVRPL